MSINNKEFSQDRNQIDRHSRHYRNKTIWHALHFVNDTQYFPVNSNFRYWNKYMDQKFKTIEVDRKSRTSVEYGSMQCIFLYYLPIY